MIRHAPVRTRRPLLVLPGVIALVLAACGDDGTVWAERLPPRTSGVDALDAHATWLDLLTLATTPPIEDGAGADVPTMGNVELEPPALELNALEEMRRGRAKASRVLSDQRRAWITAPLSAAREIAVDVPVGGVLRTAFGVHVPGEAGDDGPAAPGGLPAGVVVRFAVYFDPGDGRRTLARGVLADADLVSWHAVRAVVPGPGELVFAAELEGASTAIVAAAFANPSLERELSRVPDVVLVSVDTLRADRLGCYGYARPTSPNIDRLAEGGVVFERCISQAPWTLPSYGSLFTSLYPTEHRAGVSGKAELWTRELPEGETVSKQAERMADTVPTLAGELARAGYRTAGFYFNPYLNPRAGVSRGFDEYAWIGYSASAGVDRALAWMDANEGLPRFLFLHLIDPHWPYAPPAPFDERFAGRSVDSLANYPWGMQATRNNPQSAERRKLLTDLYDGEIAYADDELGRLFERLDDARTLVVFHSDHGEEFWDHGRFEHGHSMHEELLRVPFVLSFPSALRPARVPTQVRVVDIFPTVLDLLGLEVPDGLRGSSLVPLARGDVSGVHLVSYSESILHGRPYAPFDEAKAMTADGWTIVVGDGDAADPVLYRFGERPPESTDVSGDNAEATERLRKQLGRTFRDATLRAVEGGVIEYSAEQQNALEGLGYVDGH
jgi:arylsulfatase A-like enzyme